MLNIAIPAKAVCTLAVVTSIAEVLPDNPIAQAGQITLVSALVAAVVVLWKALVEKDKQLMEMSSKVTETMTLVLEAVKELRGTVDDLRRDRQ